jgi:hypothetical protein
MAYNNEIVIRCVVEAEEFWQSLTGCAWENCPWWFEVNYTSGSWDVIGDIIITAEDPDDELGSITKTITIDDLAKAYETVGVGSYLLDWQNLDCFSGDVIFQQAFYGKVIFG